MKIYPPKAFKTSPFWRFRDVSTNSRISRWDHREFIVFFTDPFGNGDNFLSIASVPNFVRNVFMFSFEVPPRNWEQEHQYNSLRHFLRSPYFHQPFKIQYCAFASSRLVLHNNTIRTTCVFSRIGQRYCVIFIFCSGLNCDNIGIIIYSHFLIRIMRFSVFSSCGCAASSVDDRGGREWGIHLLLDA